MIGKKAHIELLTNNFLWTVLCERYKFIFN